MGHISLSVCMDTRSIYISTRYFRMIPPYTKVGWGHFYYTNDANDFVLNNQQAGQLAHADIGDIWLDKAIHIWKGHEWHMSISLSCALLHVGSNCITSCIEFLLYASFFFFLVFRSFSFSSVIFLLDMVNLHVFSFLNISTFTLADQCPINKSHTQDASKYASVAATEIWICNPWVDVGAHISLAMYW